MMKSQLRKINQEEFNIIDAICQDLIASGGDPILVGGVVRDLVLDNPSDDFDVEVFNMTVNQLEKRLAGFGEVDLIGKKFGVLLLKVRRGDEVLKFDFAVPSIEIKVGNGRRGFDRKPDPNLTFEEASIRRDFDFNAMGLRWSTDEIIDPHNGCESLRKGKLNATSNKFIESTDRVERGMRFCGQFDLVPTQNTIDLCKSMQDDFASVSTEMHWKSWRKWAVASVKPSRGLEFLVSAGWEKFFPQIEMSEETFQRIDEVAELFREASDKEKVIAIFSAIFGEDDEAIRSFFTQFDQANWISQVTKHGIIAELAGVKGLKAFMTGNLKPALTGKDLIARGMKPGPEFGEILNAAWKEQLSEFGG